MSLDLLVIVGVDCYFKRVNPAVTRLLGYGSAEVIDRQLIDFVHPEDRAATIAIVSELSQGKQIGEFENRYRCKDGSYKWLCWRGVTVAGLIYAVAHDITDRKQTELTLKKLNEALEIRVAERTAELGYRNGNLIFDRKRAESALRASKARPIEQKEQLQKTLEELQQAQVQLVNSEKMSSLGQLGRNKKSGRFHLWQSLLP
ncbi:MAG: PAS domain S-box protein [Hormoscilla sp. SP5CHS1]|nr:PAS domain S-box protein [Hormoscilla sp. SP12CHS1]MBC6453937.1 PAS domain S-box protein [Hormoscilla sp. SP5CHS1]